MLTQAKIGKNKGGFSILVLAETKKLPIQTSPKITIKISSTLISRTLPPSITPAPKLGERPMAKVIKSTGKYSFLKIFIKQVKKPIYELL